MCLQRKSRQQTLNSAFILGLQPRRDKVALMLDKHRIHKNSIFIFMMLTKLAHVLKYRAFSTVQKIPKRKAIGQRQAGFRLPASTIDPGRLIFQSCTIRIGKGLYLYGLNFAGLTYSSLYGWLAWVELHLVNSKLDCQRLVCSCQKQSHSIQLKKETIYAFRVQATSASSNDHRLPSPHILHNCACEQMYLTSD